MGRDASADCEAQRCLLALHFSITGDRTAMAFNGKLDKETGVRARPVAPTVKMSQRSSVSGFCCQKAPRPRGAGRLKAQVKGRRGVAVCCGVR